MLLILRRVQYLSSLLPYRLLCWGFIYFSRSVITANMPRLMMTKRLPIQMEISSFVDGPMSKNFPEYCGASIIHPHANIYQSTVNTIHRMKILLEIKNAQRDAIRIKSVEYAIGSTYALYEKNISIDAK